MLTKSEQRVTKEGLLFMYQQHPQFLGAPTYLIENDVHSFDELADIILSFQELNSLPWPDERCVIVSNEVLLTQLIDYAQQACPRIMIAYDHSESSPMMSLIETDKVERSKSAEFQADLDATNNYVIHSSVAAYNPFSGEPTPQVEEAGHLVILARVNINDTAAAVRRTRQELIESDLDQVRRRLDFWWRLNETEDDGGASNRLINFYRKCMTGKYAWIAAICDQDAVAARQKVQHLQTGAMGSAITPSFTSFNAASKILTSLAAIAAPCGYRFKSAFPDGFGSKPTKRAVRKTPFVTIISYNRFSTEAKHVVPGVEKNPHFVRGHMRHLWQQAGIDRHELPPEPHKRLVIAAKNEVRRTIVHPYWTGPKKFKIHDVEFDMVCGEGEPTDGNA